MGRLWIGVVRGCVSITWCPSSMWKPPHVTVLPEDTRGEPIWLPETSTIAGEKDLTIPLWLGVLLFGIPAGFLIWRDRHTTLSQCQRCGYDLTGNVSGTCPECGSPVPERKADATGADVTEKAKQGR
jgi:ribosomal protein L37E